MLKVSSRLFPLGTVLEGETADYNPNNFYIDGVWEQTQQGMVSVGIDTTQTEFNTIGKTGGAKTHHHVFNSMPSDGILPAWAAPNQRFLYRFSADNPYTFTLGSGGEKDSTLQPYKVVYKWKLISYSN